MSDVHIRGAAILAGVKGLRVYRQQALELLPERLHPYLQEQIRIDDWYPMADQLDLLRTLIEVLPGSQQAEDPWHWLGEISASFELREVHPTVIERGNPRATLRNLPQIWTLYHDTGTVEIQLKGERHARLELNGFPFTTDEYCRMLTGYDLEALRLSGAEDPSVRCEDRGEDRASWEAGW